MIEGRPFLYQAIGGAVYHVDKNGVEAVWSWSSGDATVAFIDGDKEHYEPKDFLIRRSVQLIVASPPEGAFNKWINQTGQGSSVFKLAVKLWSLNELLLNGLILSLLPSTFD